MKTEVVNQFGKYVIDHGNHDDEAIKKLITDITRLGSGPGFGPADVVERNRIKSYDIKSGLIVFIDKETK